MSLDKSLPSAKAGQKEKEHNNMKIPHTKKWFVIEREDYAHYLYVVVNYQGISLNHIQGFPNAGWVGAEYIDKACNLWILYTDWKRFTDESLRLLIKQPKRWDALHRTHKKDADELFAWGRKMRQQDVTTANTSQLIRRADEFQTRQARAHVPRGFMWLLETPENIATNYLQDYLVKQYQYRKGVKTNPRRAFQIMVSWRAITLLGQEKIDLATVGKIRSQQQKTAALKRHADKYAWLEYGLQGSILSLSHFKKELVAIQKKGYARTIREIQSEPRKTVKKQQRIMKEYGIDMKHREVFRIVQDSNFLRLHSKYAQFCGFYCIEPVLRELGQRIGLSLEQMRFLGPGEYARALRSPKQYDRITTARQRYSIHLSHRGTTEYWHGKKARQLKNNLRFVSMSKHDTDVDELSGQPVYSGKVIGNICIVNNVSDMKHMKQNNVLVSHMTNPDIVPAMKQAAAIVTDMGGLTCHAAIVAREMKKPCVIGTKIATKVLKDGDRVEVNADKGIVTKK